MAEPEVDLPPMCYDCLSAEVAVEIRLPDGYSIWLCAEDWAAEQQFADTLRAMFARAASDSRGHRDSQ